jgi:transposase
MTAGHFDAEDYKHRNVVEQRLFNRMKNRRGLVSRYDKLAALFRGSVVLAAIVDWLR